MAHRNPIVVANWKMHTNLADAMVLAESIKDGMETVAHVEAIIAPPSVWLYPIAERFTKHPLPHLKLAAQNIHHESQGPFTGELSADMLRRLVDYALVGHSERIQFGETPTLSNLKVKRALENNLKPIVFVSDQHRRFDQEKMLKLVDDLLEGVAKKDYDKLALVYEPVWAISSNQGDPASASEIERATLCLKNAVGQEPKILYGGSVDPQNIDEFMSLDSLDGVVVGAASLKIKEFVTILQSVASRYALKNAL